MQVRRTLYWRSWHAWLLERERQWGSLQVTISQ